MLRPGLLRTPVCGYPAGTLVRYERADEYLTLRVELPDGRITVTHDDDVIQPTTK